MRTLAIILAALAIALSPPPALAKGDKPPPRQEQRDDKAEPPAQAKQATKPTPPGQAKDADKPGPPGRAKTHDEPPGQAKKGETSAGPADPEGPSAADELDAAQQAVKSHEALPLARIITIAEARTTGRVIDARLLRVSSVLLYQLTFLDDAGRSWRAYFYARTGNPVTIR